MTPAELLAAVITLTNQDQFSGAGGVGEQMVQAATLRMHQSDFYARDMAEATINLGSSGFTFSFGAPATFARYRALSYLRKYDNVSGVAGDMIAPLDPKEVLNEYGVERINVWYAAGDNIVLRSNSAVQYMLAGWYQNPIITPFATLSSWIATTIPYAIIFDACSLIFQMIAQQEQSRKYDALVMEQLNMVRQHGVLGRGY